MKITKYEYLKYVFIFANIYSAFLVYFFLQSLVEKGVFDEPGLVLPITAAAGALTAIMSYLSFRYSPNTQKTKEQTVDTKYIVLTIIEFLIVIAAGAYIISNPGILFPEL